MAVDFTLMDEELATADIETLTSGMGNVAKAQWYIFYTHRAINRQGRLADLYMAGSTGILGYDIDIPSATEDLMKAEVNNLADRMLIAQTFIATLTE